MIQYRVKGNAGQSTTMEIIEEHPDGYHVLIIREYDNFREESREYLSAELFETCLRTGYLTAIEADPSLMTA
ncbi:MAG: hypothetical protein JEY99_07405 [Spirochaetales bacterium]|nr:hypothetical protein [Spirochaetales bacterium]